MKKVMNYIIGGIIALLVLFSLTPTVFSQYNGLQTNNVTVNGTEYTSVFQVTPNGVEAVVGALLTIFFVLVLWKLYKDAA